jgi:succinoglycan biosynthesis transport protein ExoP
MPDSALPLSQPTDGIALAEHSRRAATQPALQPTGQVELIELYTGIEQCLRSMMRTGMLVQFVSHAPGESCDEIAMDLATAASETLGKRILVIDGSIDGLACGLRLPEQTASLTDRVHSLDDAGEGIIKLRGRAHYIARLRGAHDHKNAFAAMDEIARLLDKLRAMFDMTILLAPPASVDPLFSLMAPHVDGSILVVAAERTRRSAAIHLSDRVARAGGRVIGSILSQRRVHVPRWFNAFL